MSDSLYITATEARSGKSLVCLGVMEMLMRRTGKVGFFMGHSPKPSGAKKSLLFLLNFCRDNEIPIYPMSALDRQ